MTDEASALPERLRRAGATVELHGGVIDQVHVSAAGFLAWADELARATPSVELRLTSLTTDDARALRELPQLAVVDRLAWFEDGWDEAAALLLSSPHLTGLRRLSAPVVDRALLDVVRRSPALQGLDALWGDIDAAAFADLLASTALPALEWVSCATPLDGALAAMALPHRRARWAMLDLTVSDQGRPLLEAFLEADLPRLTDLDLTNLDRHAAWALSEARMPALRGLGLRDATLSAEELARILHAPIGQALDSLTFAWVDAHLPGDEWLAEQALPRLRTLRLHQLHPGSLLTEAISTWDLPALVEMVVRHTRFRDLDVIEATLATVLRGRRLQRLDLSQCEGLTAASLLAIARSPDLAELRALPSSWQLSLDELRALLATGGVPHAHGIEIRVPPDDRAAAEALIAGAPRLRLG